MKPRGLFVLLVVGLLYLGMTAWPDIAPPQYPGGGDPGPESEETQVQMLSERVVISVQMNTSMEMVYADVDAVFWMRNQGEQDESMEVYFPAVCTGDEFPGIQDFQAEVNGTPVPTRYKSTARGARPFQMYPVAWREVRSDVCFDWYTFPVTFPVKEPVVIHITYTLQSAPYSRTIVDFRYRLDTGSEWKGPIGEGNIIFRLPYEARIDNAWVYPADRHNVTYKDGVLRVDFENLEPSQEDNLTFITIVPSMWYPVLDAERDIQKNPNDGEAWGRLAKALKTLILWGKSGAIQTEYQRQEWPRRISRAYEKAVQLRPADPLWHLGFAEWLWYCYTDSLMELPSCKIYPQEEGIQRAIEETYKAYQLAPQHPKVRETLQRLAEVMAPYIVITEDGQVIFHALTPTVPPTPTGTATFTPVPSPTATARPSPTATSSPTPSPTAPPTATETPTSIPTATLTPGPTPVQQGPSATSSPPWLWMAGLAGIILLATLLGLLLWKATGKKK